MNKMFLLAVSFVLCGSIASAEGLATDFDGISGRTAAFTENLPSSQVPEAVFTGNNGAEAAGQVLNVSVEKNATSKTAFSANGAPAEGLPVKFLIKVNSPAVDSEWAIGVNDMVYSLGSARQAPEFAAVRKLADALALTGNAAAKARGKTCETDTSFVCVNGQTNECKVDKCGWCGKWEDGTWGCEWTTYSAPYACRPNGFRC